MVGPLFAQTSNSNASGNLQTKVLLTVSPFRSSFLQPPAVHPANNRFFTPLFSTSSESIFFATPLFSHLSALPPGFFSCLSFPHPKRICGTCERANDPLSKYV